ncbi:MAG: hypothetical protein R3B13_21510 [Polyangiaceae bacterium]
MLFLAFAAERLNRWADCSMPAPSVLRVLWLIHKRPSMYLGWDDSQRRRQLHALHAILTGYGLALQQHRVGQDDLVVLGELEAFLRQRSGADNLVGIDQILSSASSDDEAWTRTWALIEEFTARKSVDL